MMSIPLVWSWFHGAGVRWPLWATEGRSTRFWRHWVPEYWRWASEYQQLRVSGSHELLPPTFCQLNLPTMMKMTKGNHVRLLLIHVRNRAGPWVGWLFAPDEAVVVVVASLLCRCRCCCHRAFPAGSRSSGWVCNRWIGSDWWPGTSP